MNVFVLFLANTYHLFKDLWIVFLHLNHYNQGVTAEAYTDLQVKTHGPLA